MGLAELTLGSSAPPACSCSPLAGAPVCQQPTAADSVALEHGLTTCWVGMGGQADPFRGGLPETVPVGSLFEGAGSIDAVDLFLDGVSRENSRRVERDCGVDSDQGLVEALGYTTDIILSLGSRQNSQTALALQDYTVDEGEVGANAFQEDVGSFFQDDHEELRDAEASALSQQMQEVAAGVLVEQRQQLLWASPEQARGGRGDIELPATPSTPSTVGRNELSDCEDEGVEAPGAAVGVGVGTVVTLVPEAFEAELIKSFGAVKDSKLLVFQRYAQLFREMEAAGVAVATVDPAGKENCVFGWQKIQFTDIARFFAEVDRVVREVLHIRDPEWPRALTNFYERMNELSIAPDGKRLRPEGGYFFRPSNATTRKRVTPKYEFNPHKAGRPLKKRGWNKNPAEP